MATDQPTPGTTSGLECGAALTQSTGGALRITGTFPATVPAGAPTLTGSVEVTAAEGKVAGVVTPQADAFLVRDGRVVTLPLAQDSVGRPLELADGRAERLPATASLVPCSGSDRLAVGSYDVYVRVVLSRADGSRADSLGGPWSVEVG